MAQLTISWQSFTECGARISQNLDEGHTLVLNAVQLDPGNLHYRLSTANILLQMQRPTDAIAVLQNAASLAKTPDEVNSVENLLEAAQQYQASHERLVCPALRREFNLPVLRGNLQPGDARRCPTTRIRRAAWSGPRGKGYD